MINEIFTQEWFDSAPKLIKSNNTLDAIRSGATRFLAATEKIAEIQREMGKKPEDAMAQLVYMKKNFTRSEIAHAGDAAERDLVKWQKKLERFLEEKEMVSAE